MHCYVTLSNVFKIIHIKTGGQQPAACWPVTRYVILLFVFNTSTVCYGYSKSNFRGFRRFLIHGNLCCFIIYISAKITD